MKLNFLGLVVLAIPYVFISSGSFAQQATPDPELVSQYNKAVKNSAYTADSKICNTLFAVADNNHELSYKTIKGVTYVLAVSLKGDASYFPTKPDSLWSTGKWDSWVTMSPELKGKVKGENPKDIDMRLKQLLGLPPGSTYSYFVEMWVQPKDLFRPCPDKEITDNSCGLCFPPNTDSTHRDWINSQRLSRFFVCDTAARYPWTELGYTYDWSPENPTHVGCSEYVIRKNSYVYVNKIYTVKEYLYGTKD